MINEVYMGDEAINEELDGFSTEEALRIGQSASVGIESREYYIRMHGKGTPLICLHGFAEDGGTWDGLTIPGYRTYAIDMLGHGKTSVPWSKASYSAERVLDDLRFLCEVISGRESFVLLGYSMGGRLALQLALAYPHLPYRALILESAAAGIEDEEARNTRRLKDEALADTIEGHDGQWFADYWEALPIFDTQKTLPAAVRQAIRNRRMAVHTHGIAGMLRGTGQGVLSYVGHRLDGLTMPTLFISGELDKKYDDIRRREFARWPHITTVSVAGAGHNVHTEKPKEFRDLLALFLGSMNHDGSLHRES